LAIDSCSVVVIDYCWMEKDDTAIPCWCKYTLWRSRSL
jgi:hypothetical protein